MVGTDKAGMLHVVSVPESHKMCIGKNFQEKIVFGVIGWFFHMVSDMAGSSGSLMGGGDWHTGAACVLHEGTLSTAVLQKIGRR